LRAILAAFGALGMSFELEQQSAEKDYGYIRWSANAVSKMAALPSDMADRLAILHRQNNVVRGVR